MKLRSLAWAFVPLFLGLPARPQPNPDGQVNALALSSANGTARLVIAADRGVDVRESKMQNPDRLVLDFEPATMGEFAAYDGQQRGNVVDVRVNQYKRDVVRVIVQFDRMPDCRVEQDLDGHVTVTFADTPFSSWGVGSVAAMPTVTVAPRSDSTAAADPTALGSQPEPVINGLVRVRRQAQDTARITVNWDKTDINDALQQLAVWSGQSIVTGPTVTGQVSMTIRNQTWGNIFQALLAAHGLSATVMDGGIIRVDSPTELGKLDSLQRLDQVQIRLNYAKAGEMANTIKGMLTKRGSAIADTSTNTLVVVDVPSHVDAVRQFVQGLDVKTPTVLIEAKLIFVDRTDLEQLGVKYDVGTANQFFNKIIQRTDPTTGQPYNPNVNVVDLGGNSVAAISNADQLIPQSALDLIFSTAIGGFSITSFLSALEQVQLTDVEAVPSISTLDNRQATVVSGEQTPVRVIDASSFGQANTAPRANVQFKETGIKLIATPHVTNNRQIALDLETERSSIQLLPSTDLGFNIPIQHAETKLLVNDGETAVIAGMHVTTVTRNRSSIPLIGSLPFIGKLFSYSTDQERRQDLIVLVTPRILDDPTAN